MSFGKILWENKLSLNIFFSDETQKNGLILLYDMTESGYQNFDYSLARKILDLLKVPYVLNVTVINNNNYFFIHLLCLFWSTYSLSLLMLLKT